MKAKTDTRLYDAYAIVIIILFVVIVSMKHNTKALVLFLIKFQIKKAVSGLGMRLVDVINFLNIHLVFVKSQLLVIQFS